MTRRYEDLMRNGTKRIDHPSKCCTFANVARIVAVRGNLGRLCCFPPARPVFGADVLMGGPLCSRVVRCRPMTGIAWCKSKRLRPVPGASVSQDATPLSERPLGAPSVARRVPRETLLWTMTSEASRVFHQ